MVDLKVMEYNILNGFVSRESGKFEEDRFESVKQIVKNYSPDILVFTEAVVYDEFDKWLSLRDYAQAFGYNFAVYGRAGSNDVVRSSVVLSNYYMEGVDYSVPGFGFLGVSVSLDDKKLNLDVFHPKPQLDDEERAKFVKCVLRDFKMPYVLTGDFNSISPQDDYDKQKVKEGFSKVHPGMEKIIVDSWFKMAAIQEVLDHGLKDTFKVYNEIGYTVPTDFLNENKSTAVRLDYIFASSDIEILDSGIIQNELTEKASDHHPTYAKLRIENGEK